MDYKIIAVTMEDEFKVCPSCGYKDGFHSMLKKEGDVIKMLLFVLPAAMSLMLGML